MGISKGLLFLIALLLVGVVYFAWTGTIRFRQHNLQLADGSNTHAYIGNNPFFLIVANSPESIAKGLGGRTQIGADGMLFILPKSQIATFWMKDMLIDLDFVWISEGKVVEVTEKVLHPQPNTPDENLRIYSPHQPVDEVLELPAGQVSKLQIKVGDQLEIK